MITRDEIVQTIGEASSLHSRHTLSKGYGQACSWLESRFAGLGLHPVRIRTPLPAGPRIPEPMVVDQVAARIHGQSDETVIVGAHLDSLNLEGPPEEARAPGANDNASGLAAMLACAKLLAGSSPRRSILFVGFAAEEQGLLGARHLASVARDSRWPVAGVLTSDMIGSPWTGRGKTETWHVRCFSDEGPSRSLARWIEWTVRQAGMEFGVKLVLRRDRFGRGGDHTPFAEAGFPAVRFTEARENYRIQHSSQDLLANLDPDYVANTARVCALALERLAHAQPGPARPRIVLSQSHDTTLEWDEEQEVDVYWRDTRSAHWEACERLAGTQAVIRDVNKDDHVFGVAGAGGVPVEAA